jgi:hypothetical protein
MSDSLDSLKMKKAAILDSAGDPIAPDCEVIEVHVAELKQLFNAIDPSPFREKDLDVDRPAGLAEEPDEIEETLWQPD